MCIKILYIENFQLRFQHQFKNYTYIRKELRIHYINLIKQNAAVSRIRKNKYKKKSDKFA